MNEEGFSMIVSTTFQLEGYKIIQYLGLVRGIVVRTPTIGQGFLGGLQNIIGGKIQAFTEMCETTRAQAYIDMVDHAKQLGANAVVGVQYDASDVSGGTEVLCFGTAVKIQKIA
jgi:uncharacterized protein YbjQ (UPF0145 family)